MRVRSVADSTFIVSLCKKGIAGGSDRWISTPIVEQYSFYFAYVALQILSYSNYRFLFFK